MTLVELVDEDFDALLSGDGEVRDGLRQPPGGIDDPAVLAHVRRMVAQLERTAFRRHHWMMVADGEVVGLCGCKGPPSESGEVEIGYGVAPSRRERGHATAAVRALLEAVGREADVRAVVALTALDNVPSQCVLLRNGFVRTGTQPDPDDGEVIVWRRDV